MMQQTEKYKLNLIEKDDVFSPDALNENMEKVEAAITAGDAALDQRVIALEAHKIVVGYVVSQKRECQLGFTPKAVLVTVGPTRAFLTVLGGNDANARVSIIEGGFTWDSNPLGNAANYLAFT